MIDEWGRGGSSNDIIKTLALVFADWLDIKVEHYSLSGLLMSAKITKNLI